MLRPHWIGHAVRRKLGLKTEKRHNSSALANDPSSRGCLKNMESRQVRGTWGTLGTLIGEQNERLAHKGPSFPEHQFQHPCSDPVSREVLRVPRVRVMSHIVHSRHKDSIAVCLRSIGGERGSCPKRGFLGHWTRQEIEKAAPGAGC